VRLRALDESNINWADGRGCRTRSLEAQERRDDNNNGHAQSAGTGINLQRLTDYLKCCKEEGCREDCRQEKLGSVEMTMAI
jgi:hypothetical protein